MFFASFRKRESVLMRMISTQTGLKMMLKAIIASIYGTFTVLPGVVSFVFFCDPPSDSLREVPLLVFTNEETKA